MKTRHQVGPRRSFFPRAQSTPFGSADPELKAYFRTVDNQLKEWQQNWDVTEEDEEDMDLNESPSCFIFLFIVLVKTQRMDARTTCYV
jgi:hypothetical protein